MKNGAYVLFVGLLIAIFFLMLTILFKDDPRSSYYSGELIGPEMPRSVALIGGANRFEVILRQPPSAEGMLPTPEILVPNPDPYYGWASGFLINDHTLVTASHVASAFGDFVTVMLPGLNMQFVLEGQPQASTETDLALYTLPPNISEEIRSHNIQYFNIANENPSKGQVLFLLTYNPWRLGGGLFPGAGPIPIVGFMTQEQDKKSYIKVGLASTGGDSGSPIVYYDKESDKHVVVGIHSSGNPDERSGYAVAGFELKPLLNIDNP